LPRIKLRDRAAEQLVEIIASRDLADGKRLPSERALGSHLGVSRTVVREALNLLEARGLVRVEHGRGAIVRTDTSHVVRDALLTLLRVKSAALWDLHEIRKILEVEIASLAAQRAHPEDLQRMRSAVERMRARIGSPEGYIDADVEFHSHLARGTGNQVLLWMIEPIGQLLRASRQVSASRPGSARRALREHETILHAVSAGDARRAREAMHAHLQATERDLMVVTGQSLSRQTRRSRAARKGRHNQ
jgi:GntR family transcriptional repressor for pyruvate dehydrogenase complex